MRDNCALVGWEIRITTDYKKPLGLLDLLYADTTRYVTRSVANHLNDIAKIDPQYVVQTLKRWKQEGKQKPQELEYITKHALRTLIKQGYHQALAVLGYTAVNISNPKISITNPKICVGEILEFYCDFISHNQQRIIIDYVIYFQSKTGDLKSKVFKLKSINAEQGELIHIFKKHPIKIMTTRTLYPGEHKISLRINGLDYEKVSFELVELV